MYCGKCGNDDNTIITQEIEQDGNVVVISSFAICEKCGELLGIKDIFTQTDWDYIDEEKVKKTLDKYPHI